MAKRKGPPVAFSVNLGFEQQHGVYMVRGSGAEAMVRVDSEYGSRKARIVGLPEVSLAAMLLGELVAKRQSPYRRGLRGG